MPLYSSPGAGGNLAKGLSLAPTGIIGSCVEGVGRTFKKMTGRLPEVCESEVMSSCLLGPPKAD